LDFHFFITKNLSLGFGNSFRYGYLLDTYDQIEGEFGVSPTKKTLITDHHIYLDYHIPVFKESELFVRAGKSMLNNGTNYSKKTTYYQDDNIIGHSFGEEDFFYFATNFGIGWKKKRIELVG